MKHLGDITKIHGYDIPIVDVITGGSPCQDLSVAGARRGLAGERSGLFMEQIRIIKEMRDFDARTNDHDGIFIRPRFMVWENVPGAFSSNDGEDFRRVLEEIARVADPTADIPRPTGGVGAPLVLLWEEDFLLRGDYTTRNFGEYPNEENVSLLSQILEAKPSPKYFLSEKACLGILDRANRKGKTLPIKLEEALMKQAGLCRSSNEPGKTGGAKAYSYNENEPPRSQQSTIKASCDNATAFVAGGHYRYKEDNKVGTLMTGTSVRGDTTLIYGKSDFGTYKEDSGTLRASGGDYGGGSEMLVIQKGGGK